MDCIPRRTGTMHRAHGLHKIIFTGIMILRNYIYTMEIFGKMKWVAHQGHASACPYDGGTNGYLFTTGNPFHGVRARCPVPNGLHKIIFMGIMTLRNGIYAMTIFGKIKWVAHHGHAAACPYDCIINEYLFTTENSYHGVRERCIVSMG